MEDKAHRNNIKRGELVLHYRLKLSLLHNIGTLNKELFSIWGRGSLTHILFFKGSNSPEALLFG